MRNIPVCGRENKSMVNESGTHKEGMSNELDKAVLIRKRYQRK
jgi:hypothetical protein